MALNGARTVVVLLGALFCFISATQADEGDLIKSLPGLTDPIKFKQYSGYLNGTDDRKLHYWFVESERSPKDDPLVLWLNGGPGCSSLLGLLTEQGPFRLAKDQPGKVFMNPQRWNTIANMLFIESPAGVGFSYREKSTDYTINDDQVAEATLRALKHFFLKFPQYKPNQFFITGESYAGIYVPTLASKVLHEGPEMNFQGVAIGNGYLDQQKLGDSLLLFGYFHGLYGKTSWTNLLQSCCTEEQAHAIDIKAGVSGCNFVNNKDPKCEHAVAVVYKSIMSSDINMYNLYQECDFPTQVEGAVTTKHNSREAHDRKLVMKSLGMNATRIRSLTKQLKDTPPCVDDSWVIKYVNSPEVRTALHIPSHVQPWDMCSGDVESTYQNIYSTMKPFILELVKAGKRVLIYNGDIDMACNFLGDEWFVDDLGLKLVNDYKEWHNGLQCAGWVKHFEGLVFATVRGAGHMVPTDKAANMLLLISGFLE